MYALYAAPPVRSWLRCSCCNRWSISSEPLFRYEAGANLVFRKLAIKGIDVVCVGSSCSLMLILWKMRFGLVDAKSCLAGTSTDLDGEAEALKAPDMVLLSELMWLVK